MQPVTIVLAAILTIVAYVVYRMLLKVMDDLHLVTFNLMFIIMLGILDEWGIIETALCVMASNVILVIAITSHHKKKQE